MNYPAWLPTHSDIGTLLDDHGFHLHNVQETSFAYIKSGPPARIVQVPVSPDELEWVQVEIIAARAGMPMDECVAELTRIREAAAD